MGRVKEIFTEVQEMFDGEIPSDFDIDAYFTNRVNEIKEARHMSTLMTLDDFEDLGICPN